MGVLLQLKNITKKFPGVLANDKINLSILKNEIHSLLGENGAGKSTLMNILYGLYEADEGSIIYKGNETKIHSPKDAIGYNIGMIHQEFMLVSSFNVIENIAIGDRSNKNFFLKLKDVEEKIVEISNKYNFGINPWKKIADLSVGEQQKIEIIKALFQNVELLILDEPTSVLTPQETEKLFEMLNLLKEQNKTIIFISHKLNEVMEISDRITVLRKGKLQKTVFKKKTNKYKLANLMVGRQVIFNIDKKLHKNGKTILKINNLKVRDTRKLIKLKGVSFEIKEGEIFGIAGVSGNGQKELVEAITGLRKAESGNILLAGESIINHEPSKLRRLGGSHIPENRQTAGLILEMALFENFILENHYQAPYSIKGRLQPEEIKKYAKNMIKEYDIRVYDEEVFAKLLSGGNQQKAILACELSKKPSILIAAQPTRGLDVGAVEYIHKKILESADNGCAVLLVSTDLDEIINLSDRIAVLYEEKIMKIIDAKHVIREQIGLMMAGIKVEINNISGGVNGKK